MKKLIILTSAIVFGTMVSFSQTEKKETPPTSKTEKLERKKLDPAERAKKQTERIAIKLGLTEDQKIKVNAINIAKNKKMEAVANTKPEDKEAFAKERRKINQERGKEIKALLTSEQIVKWEEMKKEHKAHKGGKHPEKDKRDPKPKDKTDSDGQSQNPLSPHEEDEMVLNDMLTE